MRKDIFMSMVTESDIKWDVMVSSHWHVTDLCYTTNGLGSRLLIPAPYNDSKRRDGVTPNPCHSTNG